MIKSKPNKQLGDITDTLTDFSANGSYENIANNFTLLDEKNYAYMVRTTDLENQNFTQNVKYIDEHSYNFLKKSQIFGGEILINKIGSPGRTYIMPKLNIPVSLGMNLFMIKLSKNLQYTEEFIWAFLNSKLGKLIIERKINGTVPLTIDKIAIKTLYIPKLSEVFQLKITDIINLSHQKLEYSKTLYKEAEELLLKELDLLDFKPSKENITTKSFKESFGISGRLDSEYYQPKYDDIISKIENYKGGVELLKIACNLKDTNYNPKENQYYQYVELSNIGNTGDITGFTYEMGQDLPSRARRKIKENDVIVSSIEGSLEKVALVTKEFDDSLCSTGFYVLDSEKINSETLLVLFKNQVFGQILKQNCSGTILTAMNKDEFLNIIIPIINETIQILIEEKIKKSFELKEESKKLLDLAKQAVEIAIEKDEEEAIKFIANRN
ncbi:restriction endonuclease subunit S [Aliarcobacter butzleri]|uniref:restriction endonuclease subunit S n=1 Tax=Aliarcobacter butzleri TaxID=28197 RepID=UPI003AE9B21E